MSTIDKLNRFVSNPVNLDISRSRFSRSFSHKTSFTSGKLIPIFLDEVLPGDTFDVDVSSVIRMITPSVPVLDNSFLDVYFFFVPNRIATFNSNDWQKIVGENFDGYWAQSTEYTLENTGNTHVLGSRSCKLGSAANYFGIPIFDDGNYDYSASGLQMSDLPFNAYAKIYDEFFRDQNTQAPFFKSNEYLNFLYEDCLSVNKIHDYFTSVLPSPQKGAPVLLPLVDAAPVVSGNAHTDNLGSGELFITDSNGNDIFSNHTSTLYNDNGNIVSSTNTSTLPSGTENVMISNLWADLANATATSVNQIRQAFAIQRLLEKDARGGSRYRELLKSHFGVTIPDATVQVPEYLGGKRIPLNITQVLQTSETSSTSPLGATGAFSNTSFSDSMFTKSFNEFGMLIGVACVRTSQSYSQGISKFWTRNRKFDFYWPSFANLGEQPVYVRELTIKDITESNKDEVFGYQEAWADYRYHPNMVTGVLSPNANDATFTAWTYTNNFVTRPVLNSDFMKQPSSQIGDTLVVTDTPTQFIADFYFNVKTTRPMPVYSIPGLIDHH